MKLKNRGFTLLELLLLLVILASAVSVLIIFSPMKQKPAPTPISSIGSEIVIIEQGFKNGRYYLFEDKVTKTRIFYFGGAMVILPPKTNGN